MRTKSAPWVINGMARLNPAKMLLIVDDAEDPCPCGGDCCPPCVRGAPPPCRAGVAGWCDPGCAGRVVCGARAAGCDGRGVVAGRDVPPVDAGGRDAPPVDGRGALDVDRAGGAVSVNSCAKSAKRIQPASAHT